LPQFQFSQLDDLPLMVTFQGDPPRRDHLGGTSNLGASKGSDVRRRLALDELLWMSPEGTDGWMDGWMDDLREARGLGGRKMRRHIFGVSENSG